MNTWKKLVSVISMLAVPLVAGCEPYARPTPPKGDEGTGPGKNPDPGYNPPLDMDAGTPPPMGNPNPPDAGAPNPPPETPTCTPGLIIATVCVSAQGVCEGSQTCNADGKSFGDCECNDPAPTPVNPNPPSNVGTGGTGGSSSGTGGTGGSSAGTGGSSSSNGGMGGSMAGTGGSSSGTGGSAGNSGVTQCLFRFWSDPVQDFATNFTLRGYLAGGEERVWPCAGQGPTRDCTVEITRSVGFDFWLYTGLSNPGPWAPGYIQTNGRYFAIIRGELSCGSGENPAPFRIDEVTHHFYLPPKGASLTGNDWDNDGLETVADCDDHNPSILGCINNSGGMSSQSSNVTFYTFGADYWLTPLELLPVNGQTIACQSVNASNPQAPNSSQSAIKCSVDGVDQRQEYRFNMRTGNKYLAGWVTGPTDCRMTASVYAFTQNQYARAGYGPAANLFPKQMSVLPRANTCDIVLPPAL